MKLKEILINNFMPYKGDQLIEFPQHETQNVMLLFGANMRGKTSFLNAIRWGFYGKALGRHLREIPRINLVNIDAASDNNWAMSVAIKFNHENHEYELIRKITKKIHVSQPKNDNDFDETIGLKINNTPITGDLITNEINKVSPDEISRFFLFDGELLQEYENLLIDQNEQGEKIKKHIEHALGVPALVNGRNDFTLLLKEARVAQTQDARNSSELKAYAEQQRQLSTKQTTIENDLESLKEQKSSIQIQIDNIDDALKNTEVAQSKKTELDVLLSKGEGIRNEISNIAIEKRNLLRDAWKDVLHKTVLPTISDLNIKKESLRIASQRKSILESKIKDLQKSMSSTACPTCKQTLSKSSLDIIQNEINSNMAEMSLSNIDWNELSKIDSQITKLTKISSSNEGARICLLEKQQRRCDIALVINESAISEIQEEIRGFDTDHISRQRAKRDLFIGQIFAISRDIDSKSKELDKNKSEQNQISNLISKNSSSKGQRSSIRVELCQLLEAIFSEGIDQLRDSLKEEVENHASIAFSELTTEKTYQGLSINSNYGLSIVDHEGRVLKERSAGAEQIVALSLIDGLNRTARKSGPIVMDTPLGRLDPTHRENVLKYLPKMADQVILLVHEGEIDPKKDLDSFAGRIGARYKIVRISATESKIEKSA